MTNVVSVFAVTVALTISALCHAAQPYPERPIRFVIGFPAGGPTDAAGRIIGKALSQTLGQPVIIDNRPGADGAIAPELVAKAAPDGYTLLLANASSMAAVLVMRKKPPFDPIADFVPITFVAWGGSLLVVHPGVPAKTIAELMDYARANPGKLNVAAANPASIRAMAHLNSISKMDVTNITYKGDAGALPDLLSGRVHVLVGGTNLLLPYVKEGRLRALATMTRNRSRAAPDVPTIAEAGVPSFKVYGGFVLFGPAKMPLSITEKLGREVSAVLKSPDVEDQFNRMGFDMGGPSRRELTAFRERAGGVVGRGRSRGRREVAVIV